MRAGDRAPIGSVTRDFLAPCGSRSSWPRPSPPLGRPPLTSCPRAQASRRTPTRPRTPSGSGPQSVRNRLLPAEGELLREQRAGQGGDREQRFERRVWANWSGVATLQHGGQYGICVQGQYTFPNDSLWISDGPNSCSMGTMLGKRTYTTIDRSKPAVSIEAAGGAGSTKQPSIPVQISFSDDWPARTRPTTCASRRARIHVRPTSSRPRAASRARRARARPSAATWMR